MRLSDLRNKISSDYLNNGVISGAEAKDLVKTVAGDNLTSIGKQQLTKLRDEFQDKFSAAGLAEFDKCLNKAINNSANAMVSGGHQPGSANSPLGVRLGRNLENIPTSFKLSEIQDPDVKAVLSRMDVNIDGLVNHADRDRMGFSDEQFRMFLFSALLMGAEVGDGEPVPTDLTGKRVCFSAVIDKPEAKRWAEAMGAKVVNKVDADLDFLVVGNAAGTGKDERAQILNTLGEADISVTSFPAFRTAANAADVIGPAPDPISGDAFTAAMETTIHEWYNDWIRSAYDDEISYAETPEERAEINAAMRTDLENFSLELDAPNESTADWISDRYASDDPYLDQSGVPVPEDALEITTFYFSPDCAGIGLSKDWVFDRRTGEHLDDFDVND